MVLQRLTVAIGLLSLVVLPVPFLRSDRLRRDADPARPVAVALTLLPALLAGRPAAGLAAHAARSTREPRLDRVGRLIVRRRGSPAGAACSCSPSSSFAIDSLQPGASSADSLANVRRRRPRAAALERRRHGAGVAAPDRGARRLRAPRPPSTPLAGVPGIHRAVAPSGQPARGTTAINAIPAAETANSRRRARRAVRDACARGQPACRSAGRPDELDFIHAVYGNFPLMLALIAITTFLLLARAFRSILLPLKAVLLNLLSLAAAFGFTGAGSGSRATARTRSSASRDRGDHLRGSR